MACKTPRGLSTSVLQDERNDLGDALDVGTSGLMHDLVAAHDVRVVDLCDGKCHADPNG